MCLQFVPHVITMPCPSVSSRHARARSKSSQQSVDPLIQRVHSASHSSSWSSMSTCGHIRMPTMWALHKVAPSGFHMAAELHSRTGYDRLPGIQALHQCTRIVVVGAHSRGSLPHKRHGGKARQAGGWNPRLGCPPYKAPPP